MRFPPAFLDEIRDRIPISDVIGRRVTWDRRKSQPGRGDWWACCPFHGEKTPSFHCEDSKGRYHCFGCGVSGDHFRFLTELEGLSFPEAVERLAGEAGLPMPERDAAAEAREARRGTILDALSEAAAFFRQQLHEADGAKARAYLRDRGMDPRTQAAFGLGFAPNSRNRLKEYLAGKGLGKEEIEGAGLVVHGEGIAVSYDRFRDRIMFPIHDAGEKVVAFGGRAMAADAQAKYLNSPETDVFHKGEMLFNLAKARRAAREAGTLVLVEGYMDVIMLAQAGFSHAVAPLGTAMTERQLELLWRTASEPILCFDGDAAGLKAANRAAELALPALKPGRSLRFALLPEGKDPDDLVRDGGPEAFSEVLAAARPLADLVWMRETQGGSFDTPERRADLEYKLKGLFRTIGDEAVRRHYLDDASARLAAFFGAGAPAGRGHQGGWQGRGGGGRGGYGRRDGQKGRGQPGRAAISDRLARSRLASPSNLPAPSLREIAIVVGFVNHPLLMEEEFEVFASLDLAKGDLSRLRSSVLDAHATNPPDGREALLAELGRHGTAGLFEAFEAKLKAVRLWPVLAEAAFEDAREALRQMLHLQHRFQALRRELRLAEEIFGREPTEAAYAHMMEIKSEIERVDGTEALIDGFGLLSGRPMKAI
ncbi:DNA primase [Jiella endophytica]|uniref:DNA primase n=1 Tax=Jiella endophytica TaxID=2558362 RepID=A0A4Y8RG13_9HYPH|nr:DNA primase [Jiella endophytica]TFF20400.1 DNA primase [Jiella endophytica]